MAGRWITVEAERVLYVAGGRDIILCDDHHSGPVTLVLKLSEDAKQRVLAELYERDAAALSDARIL